MAPCEQTISQVAVAAPQTVRFHLGDFTCDGCEVKMMLRSEGILPYKSINLSKVKFNGRCVRKRGYDDVILF